MASPSGWVWRFSHQQQQRGLQECTGLISSNCKHQQNQEAILPVFPEVLSNAPPQFVGAPASLSDQRNDCLKLQRMTSV